MKSRARIAMAVVVALLVHAVLFFAFPVRRVQKPRVTSTPIEVTLRTPPPRAPEAPAPLPPPPTRKRTPVREAARSPTPVTTSPTPPTPRTPTPPPAAPALPTVTPTPEVAHGGVPVPTGPRVTSSNGIDRIVGLGAPAGLGVSAHSLESALDTHADGPLSDGQRAARTALQHVQDDIADDAVTAGLSDDYFRELRNHIEGAWKPASKQLDDGRERVGRLGMLKSVADTSGWSQMWDAYLDLSKQYANGVQPKLAPDRIQRLRELMRSRNGPFKYNAITEVRIEQAKDGALLSVEVTTQSGHTQLDDGVKDAIAAAVLAMPNPPPERVAHGHSFATHWRLRATWSMVPPTAFLTGAGFDITAKGLQVDVPFQLKTDTTIQLVRVEGRRKSR